MVVLLRENIWFKSRMDEHTSIIQKSLHEEYQIYFSWLLQTGQIQYRSQIRDLVDQDDFRTLLYCPGRMSDSRVVWNSFAGRISDIRLLALTNCLNLRLGCDFRLFGCEKCFCHQFLHLYSAPGIYQRMSDAKVTAECAHAFSSFHRLCFYIFFASEKFFATFRGT